jgi:hypothetical protein
MDEEKVTLDYISVGGNRHPAAADWDREKSGLLAFGADNNVALWNPLVNHFAFTNTTELFANFLVPCSPC